MTDERRAVGTSRSVPDPRRDDLANRIAAKVESDGPNPSAWPRLQLLRASRPSQRSAVIYEPHLCLVAQGAKRVFADDQRFDYNPLQYLVVSLPLPLEARIVDASPEKPFLGFSLTIDVGLLSKLLIELDDWGPTLERRSPQPGLFVSPVDDKLLHAVHRLLTTIDDPLDRKVLAPAAEREILYRLLTGPQGWRLREVVVQDSASQRVARLVRYLEAHLDEPVLVESLAREAHMSTRALHRAFKRVTSMTPMQYLKKLRLHRARTLMLRDGLQAAEAGFRVGYQSPSQFSREFKRQFGASPRREIERLLADSL